MNRTRLSKGVAALLVLAALAVALWAVITRSIDSGNLAADEAVRADTISAIETMLTADPADADGYVTNVLAVSTGDQHQRLEQAAPMLQQVVAGLPGKVSGRVLSAGLVNRSGDIAEVIAALQAGAPELIGAADPRATIRVTLTNSDGHWLVAKTEQIS